MYRFSWLAPAIYEPGGESRHAFEVIERDGRDVLVALCGLEVVPGDAYYEQRQCCAPCVAAAVPLGVVVPGSV